MCFSYCFSAHLQVKILKLLLYSYFHIASHQQFHGIGLCHSIANEEIRPKLEEIESEASNTFTLVFITAGCSR